jgi:ubiquitin-conjugating enzyme E2 S
MRRLMRELVELKNSPPEGVRVVTSEDNMLDVTGIIEGPGEHICYGPLACRG